MAQGWIADPDLGATLIIGLDPHRLRAGEFAPQSGDEDRFAVKDLLSAEIGIVLRLTGRNFHAGDRDALAVQQAQAEFVAVQVIAGRDDPARFEG